MAMCKMLMRFTGRSPLIMANGMSQAFDDGSPKTKVNRKKTEEMEALCYRDEKGVFRFPAMAFRQAMVDACKGRKVGQRGLGGIVQGAVFTTGDWAALVHPKTNKPLKKYVENMARAVNHNMGKNGTGVIVFRPEVPEWKAEVEFEVDDEFMTDLAVLVKLFSHAGRSIGVGAWSPKRGGRYGRFDAELVSHEPSAVWDKEKVKAA